ncbi:MAG: hypothetical protein V4726_05990 [Verrucomicrobiota bacterium]
MKITAAELTDLTVLNDFTVVHIDAEWDGCRFGPAKNIQTLQKQNRPGVAFAYIDCDEEHEYARGIGLLNVPAVAYYRGTLLVEVVIGMNQDVAGNLGMVISGGPPGSAKR